MFSSILGQVVSDSVDGEAAVGDAVGHPADGGSKIRIVVEQVVVDVVVAERNVTKVAVFVGHLKKHEKLEFLILYLCKIEPPFRVNWEVVNWPNHDYQKIFI